MVVIAVTKQGYTSTIPVGSQLVFNFRFTKFVLGNSGGIKFVLLVEDPDTGDSSSITAGVEYLFALQF